MYALGFPILQGAMSTILGVIGMALAPRIVDMAPWRMVKNLMLTCYLWHVPWPEIVWNRDTYVYNSEIFTGNGLVCSVVVSLGKNWQYVLQPKYFQFWQRKFLTCLNF